MATVHHLKETWYGQRRQFGDQSQEAQAAYQCYRTQLLKNAARRDRHAAYTSLGMSRVRGALGGVYYE